MKKISWHKNLNLDVSRIDNMHRHMVDLVNELLAKIDQGEGEETVRPLLTKLREYTVYHFHDEEAFMQEIRYPGLAKHQQDHKELVDKVKKFQRDIYKHRTVTPQMLLEFLREWLLNHILRVDMDIRDFIREKERRRMMEIEDNQTESGEDQNNPQD